MSTLTQEIYEQVVSRSLSPEETRALAEMLFECYEDEMDNREADEIKRRIESGEESTISLDKVMARYGLVSKYKAT